MKSLAIRVLAAAVMALIVWVMLAAATAPQGSLLAPDKLVILSTTDVKGEVGPCG
jgi:hypothetical protein